MAWGGLVAGVRVGKATGVVYLPSWGLCVVRGVGHWAPNLHLRLKLLMPKKKNMAELFLRTLCCL